MNQTATRHPAAVQDDLLVLVVAMLVLLGFGTHRSLTPAGALATTNSLYAAATLAARGHFFG